MKIIISCARAEEITKAVKTRKRQFEFDSSLLNQEEFEKLKPKGKCLLIRHRHRPTIENVEKRINSFFDDTTEVSRIIFSVIEEITKKKKKEYKSIEPAVDILQETNSEYAESLVALFELQKAIEKIRKCRKQIKIRRWTADYHYADGKIINCDNQQVNLKDVPLDKLLSILISAFNLPNSIILR